MSWLIIPVWFRRKLKIKYRSQLLFSERNGYHPMLCVGPVCFVWLRVRG